MNHTFEEGQELVYVPCRIGNQSAREHRVVRVVKTGHKWIYISNGQRICRQSLRADGGNYSSPGRCYWSLEDYQKERDTITAWDALKTSVRNQQSVPAGLTSDQIQRAMKMLGFRAPMA